MKQKTFNKWMQQTKQECWSEKDIIYFRKAINGSSSATPEQRQELLSAAHDKTYKLHPEQQDKGTKYLLSNSLKLNGSPRKNNKLGSFELSILKSDPVHELVGFYNDSPNSYVNFVPVYRATDASGNWFEYLGVTYSMLRVLEIGSRAA